MNSDRALFARGDLCIVAGISILAKRRPTPELEPRLSAIVRAAAIRLSNVSSPKCEAPDAVVETSRVPHAVTRNPMRRPFSTSSLSWVAILLWVVVHGAAPAVGQTRQDAITPVTDAELQNPDPNDWLMWRRTLDSWGHSPLDQINRDNVGGIRMVWTRGLTEGLQQGTPLVRDGVLYMPNPRDVVQAIDATTGDLLWEHRRERPDDLADHLSRSQMDANRNLTIYGATIIDTSTDGHVFALDAATGEQLWDTEILDHRRDPVTQTSGPIIANGKVISGRSCMPTGGPDACIIAAHDALTGEELWRRRLIPGPGEPGDETWGGVPFEERRHVGSWMVPSFDPELNLVLVGTSVTSPAPKFRLGGVENKHLYHNSTLALDADTGEIVWYYQHLNDHWDLDHPF
ncbi:MAG TPA: hypothetical protein DEQ98_00855, partial [Acidobacteria bacterium]|nr:hypothetical protein [Acidobacteriota bacterium]